MNVRIKLKFYILLTLFFSAFSSPVTAQQRVDVGMFALKDTTNWQKKQFVGDTDYQVLQHEGQWVLSADSHKSASAYYREIEIDLRKTPYLNWSWKKLNTIMPGNEAEKSGDDFVARVYVIKDGGILFWKTLAINYVWSFQHKKDEGWNNPFAGSHARMYSVRDSSDDENQWFSEKRNVAADFKTFFQKDIQSIDGVAIMTDSDNSGLTAQALYGDIFFSAD